MRTLIQKIFLPLLNSDEKILNVLEQSNNYLEIHKVELADKIEEILWVQRSLLSLMPETVEYMFSGHIFPLTEAEYELEASVSFCKLGYYKHAIAALRNLLELGLLSVYWDVDDRGHIDIKKWLSSMESTPFRKTMFLKLKTNPNIKEFDKAHQIFSQTSVLYKQLCDFTHTRGVKFSSRQLGNSNVNTFNSDSLKKWFKLLTEVVRLVSTFHILKYPIGLQYTPIEEKFGMNGPMGGFLRPHEAERLKNIFDTERLKTMQAISDNDPKALSLAKWVNEQPDITDDQFREQIKSFDKQLIEMEGYNFWLSNEENLYKTTKTKRPKEYKQKLQYWKEMRNWAVEKGFLTSPLDKLKNRGNN